MKPILTAEESSRLDNYIINDLQATNGLLMMENAARSISDKIKSLLKPGSNILFLCGSGNNGGDGFAVARQLHSFFNCTIYYIGNIDKMSDDTKLNFDFAGRIISDIIHIAEPDDINKLDFNFDCIVDSLIGTGGSENLKGIVVPILFKANAADALKIAIDIPTGLNASTANYHENVFKADYTITMLAEKRAFIEKSCNAITGKICVANLGISSELLGDQFNKYQIEKSDIKKIFPKRSTDTNKNNYGKIAIIAGSQKYSGAACLSANAAVAAGAGLVHLFTSHIHSSLKPEVITHILPANNQNCISSASLPYILQQISKFDSILIGPGIDVSEDTISLIEQLLGRIDKNQKLIIDADGLRAVKSDTMLNSNVVVTPHHGEFARMLNCPIDKLNSNREDLAIIYAKEKNCNVLLKGPTTLVANSSSKIYYSTSGNPGLASGGTGDVLSGIIATLSAKCDDIHFAAACSAFLHGYAADLFVADYCEESLTASSLIDYLPLSIKHLKQ